MKYEDVRTWDDYEEYKSFSSCLKWYIIKGKKKLPRRGKGN